METNAVVLAVRNQKAVILAKGGIYEEIPNQGYYAGERIVWKCKKTASAILRRSLTIAACLVFLLTSSVIAGAKYLPWTYVSVALGETSVQYCLNARNEVLSADADTEEGQAILEQVAVMPYESLEGTMERTLSALQQINKEETPVFVEISPRFGDGSQVEKTVTEVGGTSEMEMVLEKTPWQDRGRPNDLPREMEQENPPTPPEQFTQPSPGNNEIVPAPESQEKSAAMAPVNQALPAQAPLLQSGETWKENEPGMPPDSIVPLLQGNPVVQQEAALPSDPVPAMNPESHAPISIEPASAADSKEPKYLDSQQGAAAPETAAKEEAILAQALPPEAHPRLKEEARPAPISASPEEQRMEQTVPEHLPGAGGEQNMNHAPSTQDMQGGQASQARPPSPTQP